MIKILHDDHLEFMACLICTLKIILIVITQGYI